MTAETAAVVRGRRTLLRHARPSDYDRLHQIDTTVGDRELWRYRGHVPGLDEYEAALWKNTHAILVCELLGDDTTRRPDPSGVGAGDVIGYVHLHDVDWRAGHGFFSIIAATEYRRTGLMLEACFLFGDWFCGNTPLRWLYAHAFEDNLPQFRSAIRNGFFRHLGAYRSRVAIRGVPQDVHLLGISRDDWLTSPTRARFHRRLDHRRR
ncbi:MAG: GNAT family N-acetyltransferase [Actinomycetota bacterium]